ncbi:MAG: DUF523 and DUF1722 domain-containing protein [Deltaproteobacteria bacterium]|nr:DUF523 and DUF1722 domain-containing protein [Deltaproteobacteria bacterium]MBW1818333.1 DUF523 and DUF1722 domain-containing protein [Deltaproteobacteria bacterium]
MEERIKLGVSKCLIGENVRYDGGHKLDRFIRDTLGQYVDFAPVCPEAECGLGIPREVMQLEGDPESPSLMTIQTRRDLTARMVPWARRRVRRLEAENLNGFIFKSRSPSCGMERVKVFNEKGVPTNSGMGIFARIFKGHFPLLPVEDEGRLHDPRLRENFIEAIFSLKRWRELRRTRPTVGNLVEFHTRNKYLLLSKSRKHYRAMGKLVAQGKTYKPKALYSAYETLLLETLRLKTTIKKNVSVLQHMMGYFKKHLSPDEKHELLDIISDYHRGLIPLVVPVTLFTHYVRKYGEPYLSMQTYLNPHPTALKLRNHV